MEIDVEKNLLIIEIRVLASVLSEQTGYNPLFKMGMSLEDSNLADLRRIKSEFRDLVRSLGGSRGR